MRFFPPIRHRLLPISILILSICPPIILMIERFNCALRQRVSRLAPDALSFSKMIKNHIGAIKYFICHYNKVIIGLAESILHS